MRPALLCAPGRWGRREVLGRLKRRLGTKKVTRCLRHKRVWGEVIIPFKASTSKHKRQLSFYHFMTQKRGVHTHSCALQISKHHPGLGRWQSRSPSVVGGHLKQHVKLPSKKFMLFTTHPAQFLFKPVNAVKYLLHQLNFPNSCTCSGRGNLTRVLGCPARGHAPPLRSVPALWLGSPEKPNRNPVSKRLRPGAHAVRTQAGCVSA